MSETPQSHFGNGTKLALVIVTNFFIPALGNLILVGRTAGNFVCMIICLFAWGSHDYRIVLAWSLFMDIRAYIDIFVMPAQIAKKRHEEHHASKQKGTHEEAHALRAVSAPLEQALPHHSDLHSSSDAPHRSVGDYAHGAPIAEHRHSGDAVKHGDEMSKPGDVAAEKFSHGAPLPINAVVHDEAPHELAAHVLSYHGTAQTSAAPNEEPQHTLHSHGAPLPISTVMHEAKEHDAAAHAASFHIRSVEDARKDVSEGSGGHSAIGGTAGVSLNVQAHEPEHLSHGAPVALAATHAAAAEAIPGASGITHLSPRSTGEHDKVGQAKAGGTPEHVINQHDVMDSILHQVEPGAVESHSQHSSLMHADGPFGAGIVQHASERKADSETDGGVIYDIYGEEDDDENAVHLSPLDDGLFHAVGDAAAPGLSALSSKSEGNGQSEDHGSGASHESAHHLKPVDYGDSEGGLAHDGAAAAKRQQLCPNCQNPREHNRPTCPTCGTHFDEGSA